MLKRGEGQIPLRYPARVSRVGSRAGLRSASELDSVGLMEFGLSGAIHLASSSRISSRAGATSCEPVCDQVRAISRCQDSSNLSATGRKPGLQPASELVWDQLASWIAGQRNGIWSNSITLSSSLAGRRPAR